jgi:anthranilate synthase component 1
MSLNFTKVQFDEEFAKNGKVILSKKITSDTITPVLAALKIADKFPKYHFLLESAENGNNKGRFSVLAFAPDVVWKAENGYSSINYDFEKNPQNFEKQAGNVLENLRKFIDESRIQNYEKYNLPAICSGIFGYMGYDMIRYMEKIPDRNLRDEIKIPDGFFMRPQIIVVFDSLFDEATICAPVFVKKDFAEVEKQILQAQEILESAKSETKEIKDLHFDFTSNCSEEEYCQMVERGKEYIVDGDIFQVLPSQRFTSAFDARVSPFSFYRALRHVNPSPFLFYLKLDDFVLSGSSPEIMVSLRGDKVTIRPLAGTRKRGANAFEDKRIAEELLADEKEVAEHLMLIDLGRHDVGRVSKAGSVAVTERMVIENYSHVMHISSNVEGILDKKYDALDALIAGFPAGTVSGAPKIRAMEIIEEIEKDRRSFYAGCVGYFAANGDMETCITLRSALIKNNKIYLQTGAGVVFDSNPKSEYQECLNKAQAMMRACEKVKDFS